MEVKFGSSGTLFSNLTKSPFTSVVIILVCRTIGSALADPLEAEDPPMAKKTPEICHSEKDRDRKGP